jgi:hypothetical protein
MGSLKEDSWCSGQDSKPSTFSYGNHSTGLESFIADCLPLHEQGALLPASYFNLLGAVVNEN